ncbi:hypothetical protein HLM50_17165 [Sulfitobacter sp. Ks41]|uniref:hypothetical protein n=1 Tax=unclassified Sulfitobacter TaxID=196795 RepID=UPI0023E1F176|nr:hypothetical protein [Sulfitobacter sp. Ks41]MDF3362794.1 hypothetical protein [Sulfitobacter sp. Ks41]
MVSYQTNSSFETADSKAMRDKAKHTLINLIALMEAEFFSPQKLQKLPEHARSEQPLRDIAPNWFSRPVAGVDWISLAAEAASTIQSYDRILFCLYAVRKFKSQAVMIDLWGHSGNDRALSRSRFKVHMQREIHNLQTTIVMAALDCDISSDMPPLPREDQDDPTTSGLKGKFGYQIRGSATEDFLGSRNWEDTQLVAFELYSSGYIPRLIIFEEVSTSILERLMRSYAKYGGEIFCGQLAWEHVKAQASENLKLCIDRYCRDPFMLVPDVRPAVFWERDLKVKLPDWSKLTIQGRC